MPLLAHMAAGLAIGSGTTPATDGVASGSHWAPVAPFVLPLVIAGAYGPDIVTQFLHFADHRAGHHAGHGLAVATLLTAALAAVLARAGLARGPASAVSAAAVFSHLLLDALQGTDQTPWWPFSATHWSPAPIVPTGPVGETALITGTCSLWLAVGILVRRRHRGDSGVAASIRPRIPGPFPLVLVVAIGAIAVGVFVLRESRERDLRQARLLIEAGAVEDGFALLDEAGRWPATAKAGRVDYLRGVGHLARGRRVQAEACFIRAFHADPRYLWVVFDLAIFYAGADLDAGQRRALAAPFIRSLAVDFPGQPEARRGLEKAARLLER